MENLLLVAFAILSVVGALPQESAATIPPKSRIYFANESLVQQPPKTLRTMTPPPCASARVEPGEPCVEDTEYNNHVSDYVKFLLARDNTVNSLVKDPELKFLLSDSTADILTTRFANFPQESPVCAAQETLIHPKRAKNPLGEWLFVVNQDEVKQAIRVEKCIREGSGCNMGMKLPSGATTICRQKYVYRRLLTVGTNKLQPEEVLMPSCCVCYANQSEFDITSRFRNTTGRADELIPAPEPALPLSSPTNVGQPIRPPAPSAAHIGFPNNVHDSRRTITYERDPAANNPGASLFSLHG